VRFVSEDSQLSVGVRSVASGEVCHVPCELHLPPGAQEIAVEGDRTFTRTIEVPATGGTFQLASGVVGMRLAAGILGVAVGGGIIGGGAALDGDFGTVLIVAGSLLAVNGIVWLVMCAPNRFEPFESKAARLAMPRVGMAPIRGGAMLGASWRF
jgi:hypothetical protein